MYKIEVLLILLIGVILWAFWGNSALMVHPMTCISERLPKSFDGFRIVQVSDFHNTKSGRINKKLVEMLKDCSPDVIVITGDFVETPEMDAARSLMKVMVQLAPTYYVTGNHEARTREYPAVRSALEAGGVVVLENQKVMLERGEERIFLAGMMDPNFSRGRTEEVVRNALEKLSGEEYTILLSHRPELFELYTEYNMDLVFSGHAHGGQIRLPLIGGVFAPNQGLFPRYDAGQYTKNRTTMVVSRGIGNRVLVPRIHNRPEIVLVELKSK